MADLSVLNIFLNSREVGTIAQLPSDRNLFVFYEDYMADENRPTLSVSFKDTFGNSGDRDPPGPTKRGWVTPKYGIGRDSCRSPRLEAPSGFVNTLFIRCNGEACPGSACAISRLRHAVK